MSTGEKCRIRWKTCSLCPALPGKRRDGRYRHVCSDARQGCGGADRRVAGSQLRSGAESLLLRASTGEPQVPLVNLGCDPCGRGAAAGYACDDSGSGLEFADLVSAGRVRLHTSQVARSAERSSRRRHRNRAQTHPRGGPNDPVSPSKHRRRAWQISTVTPKAFASMIRRNPFASRRPGSISPLNFLYSALYMLTSGIHTGKPLSE